MITDIHAHYVPPKAIEIIRKDPGAYGAKMETSGDGKERLVFSYGEKLRPFSPAILDLEDRKQRMDQQGVEHEVLSPWPDVFGYALPTSAGIRWSRLLNDKLAESVQEHNEAFSGMATVPLQDAEAAAGELHRAVLDLGFRSVMIASNVAGKELDDESLDPFWEEVVSLNVPIVIHPLNVAGEERVNRFYMRAAVGYPYDTTIAAGYMMLGGVFDRFPKLKVVLVHGGAYLPYQIGRLQRAFEAQPEAQGSAQKTPLEYFKLLYFDSIVHSPLALHYLVEIADSERILLGTDEPFGMGDPDPRKTIREACLTGDDITNIQEHSAQRLFNVEEK